MFNGEKFKLKPVSGALRQSWLEFYQHAPHKDERHAQLAEFVAEEPDFIEYLYVDAVIPPELHGQFYGCLQLNAGGNWLNPLTVIKNYQNLSHHNFIINRDQSNLHFFESAEENTSSRSAAD